MLKGKLIHPDIMAAPGPVRSRGQGPHRRRQLAPMDSKTGQAETVYLGLTPGLPTVTDVLAAIQSTVNIEKAEVMDPARRHHSGDLRGVPDHAGRHGAEQAGTL